MEKELQNARKLESLGVLAGGIAHDFNNLMGGIFGYIDLALEDCEDPKISRYLAKTMNTIERARGLTQQLLTFSKGGSPVRKLDDLFPLVQETAQFALSGSNVSCTFDVAGNLWWCNFDNGQIGQVVDNIVINAQQAMPGGGTIEISAENISFLKRNILTLWPAGNMSGFQSGTMASASPKRFCPAYSIRFIRPKAKGHGLGLAICHSIIHRHGGCIDVESDRAKAACFMCIYPPRKTPRRRRRPLKS